MAKFARGGATKAAPWDGTFIAPVYLVAGADGEVTGTTSGGDTVTFQVKAAGLLPLELNTITAAPDGSVVIW